MLSEFYVLKSLFKLCHFIRLDAWKNFLIHFIITHTHKFNRKKKNKTKHSRKFIQSMYNYYERVILCGAFDLYHFPHVFSEEKNILQSIFIAVMNWLYKNRAFYKLFGFYCFRYLCLPFDNHLLYV